MIISFFLFILGCICGVAFAYWKQSQHAQTILQLQAQVQYAETSCAEQKDLLDKKEAAIELIREQLARTQQAQVIAETKLAESLNYVEQQRQLIVQAEEKFKMTFQALSGEALKSNNQAFLDLAQSSLEGVLNHAKGEFGVKEESIRNIVNALSDVLRRYEKQVHELEQKRAAEYGSLETHIKSLAASNQQLQKETVNLVSALRRPEVRGRWGEVTLRRVVELAGMTAHCDFTEQHSVNTDEGGRMRPDMIIHLPAARQIVIDSKVPLDAYMDAVAQESVEERRDMLTRHAQQLRRHMKMLAAKNYWDQFTQAPEFVVMFIPGEPFLSAALDIDHTFIEDAIDSRVIVATPTTLIALIRAIAFGWRQEQMAQHAQDIAQLGKELYDRFDPFLTHLNKTAECFSQAIVSFNKTILSLERRVLVSVRKFQELGAAGDKELPEVKVIEQQPMIAQEIDIK